MSSVPTDQGNILPVLIVLPQTRAMCYLATCINRPATDLVMLFRVIFGTGSFETFAASKFTMYDQLYILTNFSEAVDYFYIVKICLLFEGTREKFLAMER